MDAATKTTFKAQLSALSAANSNFKSSMGIPVSPVMGGMPPMPIIISSVLMPHLMALKTHAEEFDKLIRLLSDLVDKL